MLAWTETWAGVLGISFFVIIYISTIRSKLRQNTCVRSELKSLQLLGRPDRLEIIGLYVFIIFWGSVLLTALAAWGLMIYVGMGGPVPQLDWLLASLQRFIPPTVASVSHVVFVLPISVVRDAAAVFPLISARQLPIMLALLFLPSVLIGIASLLSLVFGIKELFTGLRSTDSLPSWRRGILLVAGLVITCLPGGRSTNRAVRIAGRSNAPSMWRRTAGADEESPASDTESDNMELPARLYRHYRAQVLAPVTLISTYYGQFDSQPFTDSSDDES